MPTTSRHLEVAHVEEVIGIPFADWAHNCHGISLAIVKAGLVPGGRIARGTCLGVFGQHSWIVDGPNVYDRDARIIDPTLWSYRDDVDGILFTTPDDKYEHRPHGHGNIWAWGRPESGDDEPMVLPNADALSKEAKSFLRACGPLDRLGWGTLFSQAPVGGWPAGEIIGAACDAGWEVLVPIDRIGMCTDRNPGGLYLEGDER